MQAFYFARLLFISEKPFKILKLQPAVILTEFLGFQENVVENFLALLSQTDKKTTASLLRKYLID